MASSTSRVISDTRHLDTVEMIIVNEVSRVTNYLSVHLLGVDEPDYQIITRRQRKTDNPIEASHIRTTYEDRDTGELRRDGGVLKFVLNLEHIDNVTPEIISSMVAHETWHHIQLIVNWNSKVEELFGQGLTPECEKLFACLKEGSAVFFESVYASKDAESGRRSQEIIGYMIKPHSAVLFSMKDNQIFDSLLVQAMMTTGEQSILALSSGKDVLDYITDRAYYLPDSNYGVGSAIVAMLFIKNGFDEIKTLEKLSDPKKLYDEVLKLDKNDLITLINTISELYGLEKRIKTK